MCAVRLLIGGLLGLLLIMTGCQRNGIPHKGGPAVGAEKMFDNNRKHKTKKPYQLFPKDMRTNQ